MVSRYVEFALIKFRQNVMDVQYDFSSQNLRNECCEYEKIRNGVNVDDIVLSFGGKGREQDNRLEKEIEYF